MIMLEMMVDDGDYDVNAFAYGFDVFSNVLCL